MDLDRASNRPQTTRSCTACAAPEPNWNCHAAIWSRFQMPSKWAFQPTWAAADALSGPTGRIRRHRCPARLIPAPAFFLPGGFFVSEQRRHLRNATQAACSGSGRPWRRPVLAAGNARLPGCPYRGAGPIQVGPGPTRQITFCPNLVFSANGMLKWETMGSGSVVRSCLQCLCLTFLRKQPESTIDPKNTLKCIY